MADTLAELQTMFRELFQDDTLVLVRSTSAHDIAAWDSLMHVTLMMEVESHFGVRFTTPEVAYLQNVGGLVDLIAKKRSA
jgi:acyl carrier protein